MVFLGPSLIAIAGNIDRRILRYFHLNGTGTSGRQSSGITCSRSGKSSERCVGHAYVGCIKACDIFRKGECDWDRGSVFKSLRQPRNGQGWCAIVEVERLTVCCPVIVVRTIKAKVRPPSAHGEHAACGHRDDDVACPARLDLQIVVIRPR